MDSEALLRYILIAEFTSFSVMRIVSQRRASRARRPTVISESRRYAILLGVFISYEVVTFLTNIGWPSAFAWAAMGLPDWARWAGVGPGLAGLALFVWVHTSLKYELSATLKIKAGHTLVTTGPYHWVRHPMYTAFYLLHASALLMMANWFIGLTWLAGLTLIVATRVRREEAMLEAHFGPHYRTYASRTGMFLPRISSLGPWNTR
jgi:protein-S-isoprenylcysteine O-methyltransferase Ste14